MARDCVKELKNGVIRFGPEEIHYVRKTINMDKNEDRENAIDIIDQWIKSQDHFLKKDFSKAYIERCLITCYGSLEKAKKQIDKMCTLRTLVPQYFTVKSLRCTEIKNLFFEKGYAAVTPHMTKQCHRVVIVKGKPNIGLTTADISLIFKSLIYSAEYFKCVDFCLGYHVVFDMFDSSVSAIIPHVNLVEIQQIIPIFTRGYGLKLKGLYLITASKIIQTFIKVLKPLFSEKVSNRLHAVTDRKLLKNFIDVNILPADYDGPEQSVAQLSANAFESFSTVDVEELVNEMNKGIVDESKRRTDIFNDEYMGTPGTFRTLSLD